jgi:hypothetical protein
MAGSQSKPKGILIENQLQLPEGTLQRTYIPMNNQIPSSSTSQAISYGPSNTGTLLQTS